MNLLHIFLAIFLGVELAAIRRLIKVYRLKKQIERELQALPPPNSDVVEVRYLVKVSELRGRVEVLRRFSTSIW